MGKEALKEAQALGLTNLPLTTLYGRPKNFKMTFSKSKPDTINLMQKYLTQIDPSTKLNSSGGGRNNTFYCVAPQARTYVQVTDKMAGMVGYNMNNHTCEIKIYSDDIEMVKQLARTVSQAWPDGILPHVDWGKIEKKYKVRREDCIAAWEALL